MTMRHLTPTEAEEKHGMRTMHEEMAPEGECRFRLVNADGTGYIRTELPAGSVGAWQEAHSHRWLQETYIVQKGWIAFAEERNEELGIYVLKAGSQVTTQPRVRHNVYMPAGAVIHTVKHGAGRGQDKNPAPEMTAKCRNLSTETAIRRNAADPPKELQYSEEYRHFDNLIWQMPGWSTAIFLGMAAVLAQANPVNLNSLLNAFTMQSLKVGFLLVVFGFLFCLTLALSRFRIHQAPKKKYSRTKWWSSASTQLQAYVTVQAFVVLYLAFGELSWRSDVSVSICVLGFLAWLLNRELAVRNEKNWPRGRVLVRLADRPRASRSSRTRSSK